jgi:hypothetical protein
MPIQSAEFTRKVAAFDLDLNCPSVDLPRAQRAIAKIEADLEKEILGAIDQGKNCVELWTPTADYFNEAKEKPTDVVTVSANLADITAKF